MNYLIIELDNAFVSAAGDRRLLIGGEMPETREDTQARDPSS